MLRKILSQSYLITMLTALVAGIFIPQAKYLSLANTLILQIIFFLSCLKIDPRSVLKELKDWRFLGLANFMMLIGFPLAVWVLGLAWRSDFEFAMYLLAAMPVGMTAPLLVEVAGGLQSMSMVLTVTTSLLAPFTVPLMTKLLYGAQVTVDASSMFFQLAQVIFVPFALAMLCRFALPKTSHEIKLRAKTPSIVLLGMLIAGAVAKQADTIVAYASSGWKFFFTLIGLFAFYLTLHLAGYFSFWWKKREIRQTASISLTYMNFTLAIFLATQFFPKPGILLPLVFSIIPWATFMPIWLRISSKAIRK